MSHGTSPSHEYLRTSVLTAPPEQLQLMLYDGAIRFATRGLEAMRTRDREATFNALDRAQRIVLELANGLRREVNPELADQMAALYSFVYRRLVEANLRQDPQAIDDALRILRHQRETWLLLIEKVRSETAAQASSTASPSPAAPSACPPASRFRPATDAPESSFSAEG